MSIVMMVPKAKMVPQFFNVLRPFSLEIYLTIMAAVTSGFAFVFLKSMILDEDPSLEQHWMLFTILVEQGTDHTVK